MYIYNQDVDMEILKRDGELNNGHKIKYIFFMWMSAHKEVNRSNWDSNEMSYYYSTVFGRKSIFIVIERVLKVYVFIYLFDYINAYML